MRPLLRLTQGSNMGLGRSSAIGLRLHKTAYFKSPYTLAYYYLPLLICTQCDKRQYSFGSRVLKNGHPIGYHGII